MKKLRMPSLTVCIFIGLGAGVLFGLFAPPAWSVPLKPIGKLFIRLIKMIVAPLILSSLVTGLAGAGSGHIGRLLIKSLVWFWLATAVALIIGLGAANLLHPGVGAGSATLAASEIVPVKPKPFLEQVVPESIIGAMAENSILQIVFFSILFGLALAAIGPAGKPIVDFLKSLTLVMFKITEYVMRFAPIGVAAAMASAIGAHGPQLIFQLARLVGSLYLSLIVFVSILLLAARFLLKLRVGRMLLELKEALLLAFSTTSSESALPKAMQSMERLGVPEHIVGFVIPAGYSFNLDGTTLYLALASMFIAQASGMHMPLSTQIVMMLTLLLTSKGVAAVPRASLVVLSATCATFGLPVEWVAAILGVDEVMDMARTTVNVLGNCVASAAVAKWEGILPKNAPILTGAPIPEKACF
ncbi:MAG: dicarboxylate/amino acid:cation symporter [Elusimicrobiota bacterium]|jgi:proton glutamate symport protein